MKQVTFEADAYRLSPLRKATTILLPLFLMAALSACDSIPFIDNKSDYKGAGRSRPLEVPPDLTASPVSDAYSVPGSASYSSYSQAQEGQEAGVEKVLQSPDGVRMEKSGTQRWLVVDAPAEKIWPVIRDFWMDMGFAVRVENPQIGVMETEWVDADAIKKDDSKSALDKFDKWLDKLSGFADKRKFRTRLEHGANTGTTEIFMTHRSVNGAPDDGKTRIQTQLGEIETGYKSDAAAASKKDEAFDAELDAELLRRLMVKLGVEEQKSQTILANASTIKQAEVVKEPDGGAKLILNDQFDRAWRRVGLALDRVGFVIEDRDRSNGLFFVRYADVDIDDAPKKKKGLFETLKFWGDEEKKPETSAKKEDKSVIDSLKFWGTDDKKKTNPERQYRIKVSDDEKGAVVTVVDTEGAVVRTTTANRIIALMYEQLR